MVTLYSLGMGKFHHLSQVVTSGLGSGTHHTLEMLDGTLAIAL